MDRLETYRAKRDFEKTSEPSGGPARKSAKKAGGGVFVVHKHDATRLHYDLRLEHAGVLWSWAVTRGPSLDPADKRLSVHVEDHPFDYRTFEGNIPKGQYGAGSVIVWDEGTWLPEADPDAMMKKGHIAFELKGAKLNGAWHLVRLKRKPGEKRDNWLLMKVDDAFARPGVDILKEEPRSVASGRTIEDVAAGRPAKKASPSKKAGKSKTAARTPLPFVQPMLATLRAAPPSGGTWLHEVKFDGYRIQAHVAQGRVTLYTRTGLDWTGRFGMEIAEALAGLGCDEAVLDGEIVVPAENGASSFSALQAALSAGRTGDMQFYLFDILHLDGKDVRGRPQAERKDRLRALLGEDETGPLRYSEHFVQPGETMLRHVCRLGLEGIISKRADAPYGSGRGLAWIKSKCTQRQEFVVVGYLPSAAAGRGIRSLLVAYHEGGRLHYAGRVGTGFSAKVGQHLKERLDALATRRRTVEHPDAREKKTVWVRPELVAEVEFRSWTADRILRHASFQGLREDKPAGEVVAEIPEAADTRRKSGRKAAKAKKAMPKTEVTLTSPTKLLWPDAGVTKEGLLEHYATVWERMRPFVTGRPLSLVRAPDGVGGQRFFQKHASRGMHEAIARMPDPEDGEEILFVRDFDGLAALVQNGVVEVHVWGSTVDGIETPDQIVFDLDPDEGLDASDVRAATLDVKARLDELELPSFVKTSGGKGFHVVVPLKPRADWTVVKTFAHDFAEAMAASEPDRYTATLSKKARTGRIFIDYLRNGRGSTTVAPWSSRAKPGATVSVPVTFEMVADGLGPADFAIGKGIDEALAKPDPWAGFFKAGKALRR